MRSISFFDITDPICHEVLPVCMAIDHSWSSVKNLNYIQTFWTLNRSTTGWKDHKD